MSRMRNLPILLLVSFLITFPSSALSDEAQQTAHSDDATCGLINGNWLPGRILKNGLFQSYKAASKRMKKRSKKSRARKKIRSFLKLHRRHNRTCKALGTNQGSPESKGSSGSSNQNVRFDFSDAIGLALQDNSTRSGSGTNLKKVMSDGSLENVLESGSLPISRFLIAPNDKLYVLFTNQVDLVTGTITYSGEGCILAEINTDDGSATCIDSSTSKIQWHANHQNPPIQFDSSGALYYLAYNWTTGIQTLRRYLDGDSTDLINDSIYVTDFLVMTDGRIILTGTSNVTGSNWIRRVGTDGSIKNLLTSGNAQFMKQFPDGNVYIGIWQFNGSNRVLRYLSEKDTFDDRAWIGSSWSDDPHHDSVALCQDDSFNWKQDGFCNFNGAYVARTHETLNDKVFAIAGPSSDSGRVPMQYYPTVKRVQTVIDQVLVSEGILNHLIFAGLDESDRNRMTLYDTSDGSETELLSEENEVEVYHLQFTARDGSNWILFDGLRFSDNKYVIGKVNLATLEVMLTPTGGTALIDFQTL